MKFRKKPVVIDAWKWDSRVETLSELISEGMEWCSYETQADRVAIINLKIKTLEGTHNVSEHDMVIKGINGEFYPCKPDIFEKTYEAV